MRSDAESTARKLHQLVLDLPEARSPAEHEAMSKLFQLLVDTPPDAVEGVLQHPATLECCQVLRSRWAAYLYERERLVARSDVESRRSVLAVEGYQESDAELNAICSLPDHGTFVMAGCGPYPETLVRVASRRLGRTRLVGVDRSESAISAAAAIVPEGTFVVSDARAFDFTKVDVVLLANGMQHKAEVLRKACREMSPNSTILARAPVGLATLLYEDPSINDVLGHAEVVRIVRPSPLSQTYLLKVVKREGD